MSSYKRFYNPDESGISVEHWSGSMSQSSHMHKYYEMVFIEKGSCTHIFQDQEMLLLSGDSFLVTPETSHSFLIHEQTSIYNCQFYPNAIDPNVFELIKISTKNDPASMKANLLKRTPSSFQADINKQGIIHLDPSERIFIQSILDGMIRLQTDQEEHYQIMKQKYLEIILLIYQKRSDQQFKNYYKQPKQNQSMILRSLEFIEDNLTETIDFHELAQNENLSTNHYRKLFKDVTGLSPVEYINRLRITKACTYLNNSDMSMSEIAASVGIYDANYFSRLFKNFMGCSPRQYIHHSFNK